MSAKSKSNEIRISRTYDAPVKSVWEAWTDPTQTEKWWGPRGFTLTTHRKDLRPGGTWVYTMHGPDGVDYPNKTVYHEVEEYAKLVYDHGGNDDRPPLFRVTVLFSEHKGRTTMEMSMLFPSAEDADRTGEFIKKAGGYATWDRLAEYLEREASGTERFVITRSFNTSLEVMFEMWTSPEHLSMWLPPTGSAMEIFKSDIKPGGHTFYAMTGLGDSKMYGRIEYQKIERPNRIIHTQQFCDKDGKVSPCPMMPAWPETMLTTVNLTAEGPERTRVTVTWEPIGAVTPEELGAFIHMRESMTQGWTGSFDKLEALLEER